MNIHRRHLLSCPHRDRGWNFVECSCPVGADGMIDGKRFKRSLRTTDWCEAVELAQFLPDGNLPDPESIDQVLAARVLVAIDNHKKDEGQILAQI